MAEVRCMTWNVRGLNAYTKRRRILQYATHHKIDVLILQETHQNPREKMQFGKKWARHAVHAPYSNYARGVTLLTQKAWPFVLHESVCDREGRYVGVAGSIHGHKLLIISVYGPNTDSPEFIESLAKISAKCIDYDWIWAGDYNLILDTEKDRSKKGTRGLSAAARKCKDIMRKNDLCDAWLQIDSGTPGYTHYSTPSDLYTRLDRYLLSEDLVPLIQDMQVLPRTWSDHAPVTLTLRFQTDFEPLRRWRFKADELQDEIFSTFLETEIDEFIKINKGSVKSPAVLWETLKCYTRGVCYSRERAVVKTLRKELVKAEEQLGWAEREYEMKPEAGTQGKLQEALRGFTTTADTLQKYMTKPLAARRYGEGERASKYLAWATKIASPTTVIPRIRRTDGALVHKTEDINRVFWEYYRELYSSNSKKPQEEIHTYLEDIALAWLESADRIPLNLEININEIARAIKDLRPGKAPGPDGLTVDFYKHFSAKLCPLLLDVYREAIDTGHLPTTMREANIIVLPKPGKDPEYVGSYRPLSLLNSDYKILAKVIANRLWGYMDFLVMPEQAGFVPGRATSHNLRQVFSVLHQIDPEASAAVVTIDCEKAFDTLEWGFMLTVIERMGVGDGFMCLLRLLYSEPMARVITNGMASDKLKLERGTRQGCPLSPMIFALAAEVIACKIRQLHRHRAINLNGPHIAISLYADDILMYVARPEKNLRSLMTEMVKFGELSGLKINKSKTEVMPLTSATPPPATDLELNWQPRGFKYLGVFVSTTQQEVYERNYLSALYLIEQWVDRWSKLPLTMTARISLAKMVILPKLLYIFTNVPIYVPKAFFTELHSIIGKLLWRAGTARISQRILMLPLERGGLALPNFWLYYVTAQLQFTRYWFMQDKRPQHIVLEKALASPWDVRSYILKGSPKYFKSIDPISATDRAIHEAIKIIGHTELIHNEMSLFRLRGAEVTTEKLFIDLYTRLKLEKLGDVFPGGTFMDQMTFGQLSGITTLDTFMHHRLRVSLKRLIPTFPELPLEHPLVYILTNREPDTKWVTHIYKTLLAHHDPSLTKTRELWNTDLGIHLTDHQWEKALSGIKKGASNYRYKMIQFKVIHRYYYTPSRLKNIYENRSDECPRCHQGQADYMHMIWGCEDVCRFWSAVNGEVDRMINEKVPNTPLVWLLNVQSVITGPKWKFTIMASMIAKKTILSVWMSNKKPDLSHWRLAMTYAMEMERQYCELIPERQRPKDYWSYYVVE